MQLQIDCLKADLSEFGICISEEETVLKTLSNVASRLNLGSEDMVDEVVAFLQQKQLENLDSRLAEEFSRKKLESAPAKGIKSQYARPSFTMPITSRLISSCEDIPIDLEKDLSPYCVGADKLPANRPLLSSTPTSSHRQLPNISPSILPSPRCKPTSYSQRNHSGQVVLSLGDSASPFKGTRASMGRSLELDITQHTYTDKKYMFQKIRDKVCVVNDIIDNLSEQIKMTDQLDEFSSLCQINREPNVVCGRIYTSTNGKLTPRSIFLQGSMKQSLGRCIPMDLSRLNQYSFFPGQVVVAECINPSGEYIVPERIIDGLQLPFSPKNGSTLAEEEYLTVVTAAGPFLVGETADASPLSDLLKEVESRKPDILILVGPMVEWSEEFSEAGIFLESTVESVAKVAFGMISRTLSRLPTDLVYVPAQMESPPWVYPTLPVSSSMFPDESLMNRLHLAPNPCLLNVHGLLFGITSTDILFHLVAEEISTNAHGERLVRLLEHMLKQQSFYPLFPPHESVNMDLGKYLDSCMFISTPDVLLVPSDLRYFAKNVQGCLCVNSGRLAKSACTFVVMKIKGASIFADQTRDWNCSLVEIVRI